MAEAAGEDNGTTSKVKHHSVQERVDAPGPQGLSNTSLWLIESFPFI